jgi:hypothetical protein
LQYRNILNNATYTKLILLIGITLLLLTAEPFLFIQVAPGLDNSWRYALNYAVSTLKFGSDIAFTFGPLGFVLEPLNLNPSITTIRFPVYLSYITLFAFALFRAYRLGARWSLFAPTFLIWLGFYDSSYYLEFLFLLFITLCLIEKGKIRDFEYTIACTIMIFSGFVKFSMFVPETFTLLIFLLIIYFTERTELKKYLLITTLTPLVFIACYLLYNPSITDLVQYIKAAIEISDGYNTGMSLTASGATLLFPITMLTLYIILLISEWFIDKTLAFQSILFIPATFFAFKHGFVRADNTHLRRFLEYMIIFSSIKLLYAPLIPSISKNHSTSKTPSQAKYKLFSYLSILFFTLCCACYCTRPQHRAYLIDRIKEIRFVPTATPLKPFAESSIDTLPEPFLKEIGDNTVAVYPWEQLFGAYNDINLTIMPVIQAYSAYTPYLDKLDADFFTNETTAPQYIIFSLNAIDGRISLMECPATWLAIYKNYNAIILAERYLLLKRTEESSKESPDNTIIEIPLYQNDDRLNQIETHQHLSIKVPPYPSDRELLFFADFKLTTLGKAMKFLYKIPSVNLTISFDDGTELSGRVILENLQSGHLLSSNCQDSSRCAAYTNGNSGKIPIKMRFEGSGLKFYRNISYSFASMPRKVVNKENTLRLSKIAN